MVQTSKTDAGFYANTWRVFFKYFCWLAAGVLFPLCILVALPFNERLRQQIGIVLVVLLAAALYSLPAYLAWRLVHPVYRLVREEGLVGLWSRFRGHILIPILYGKSGRK